jgi:hypothetical protein
MCRSAHGSSTAAAEVKRRIVTSAGVRSISIAWRETTD